MSHPLLVQDPAAKKRRLCKCPSFCTTYNPETQMFEGDGHWLPDRTFHKHREFERSRQKEEENSRHTPPVYISTDFSTKLQTISDELDWLASLPIVCSSKTLMFRSQEDNIMAATLDTHAKANTVFFEVNNRLQFLFNAVQDMPPCDDRDEVAGQIQDALQDLDALKWRQWHTRGGTIDLVCPNSHGITNSRAVAINTEIHFRPQGPTNTVAKAAVMLAIVLQNVYFVKHRAIRVHLSGIRSILRTAKLPDDIIASIPMDPRTCSSLFDINPDTSQYIVCPKCHCIYPYLTGDEPEITPLCTFRDTPSSPECDTALWKSRQLKGHYYKSVPIRRYLQHDLKAWIGRLLSRPGIEDLLDRPFTPRASPETPVEDIWHSKVFENLKDPTGQPFFPGPGDTCRLVFGLSVDGFVPLRGNTQNATATGIWLVLFNLPPELRHLPQNVFLVGIIPGPDKPSTSEINHYLQLLVSVMLQFWDPGVFYTRTYKYLLGRLVQAILGPDIMDHPGLRQVIGLASSSNAHYMCTECDLDCQDLHITNRSEWPAKDSALIRRFMTLWRNANSIDDRKNIFNAFGWRWSALSDLPYWDPVLFSVVDSMHTLDLNLFQNHCRTLFQIDINKPGGDRWSALQVKPKKKEVDEVAFSQLKRVLKRNEPSLLYQLLAFDLKYLEHHGRWPATFTAGKRLALSDSAVLVDEDNDQDELNELLGSKRSLGECIIKRLLRTTLPAPDKAFAGSWSALYEEICFKLSVVVPDRATNKQRQEAILLHIHNNPSKRIQLSRFLPTSKRKEFDQVPSAESVPDSETEEDRTEEESDVATTRRDGGPVDFLAQLENTSDKARLIITHLTTEGSPDEVEDARAKAFRYAKVSVYKEICDYLHIRTNPHCTKQTLHDAIVTAIDNDPEKLRILEELVPEPTYEAVLGKDVMERVWSDMKLTQLPSWMSPAPSNWGTAKRGTLSANNWQIICTVHLPITLIWLWREISDRRKDLLHNFMDLVTASRLATLRISTSAQIELYNRVITRYVDGLLRLFPGIPLKPTHHTAMHIGDNISRFGPVHAINTSFYERNIKFLHFIPINGKFGELEATMSTYSSRYSNICALLADDEDLRRSMAELVNTTESIKNEDLRGFDMTDMLKPSPRGFEIPHDAPVVRLHPDLVASMNALRQSLAVVPTSDVFELKHLFHLGVRFAAFKTRNFRDSSIIFVQPDTVCNGHREIAGVIQSIFAQQCQNQDGHITVEIFLLLEEYRRITDDGVHNPYIEFGFAAGYLCHQQSVGHRIIPCRHIKCHFVSTVIPDTGYLHVLPIDKFKQDFD